MARGGGRAPPSLGDPAPPPASPSSGHYLLQLLQRPPSASASSPSLPSPLTPPSNPISSHHHDPAVAAVGPSHPFPPWPNNDPPPPPPPLLPPSPFPFLPPHAFSNLPWSVPTFPPSPFDFHNSHFPVNPTAFFPDAHQLGFPRPSADLGNASHRRPPPPPTQQQQQQRFHQDQGAAAAFDNTLTFGSLKCKLWSQDGLPNGSSSALGHSKTH